MIQGALIKYAVIGVVGIGVIAGGWILKVKLDNANLQLAAKDLVIRQQTDELARRERLHHASQATAEELQRQLEAERLREDERRKTLDEIMQAARAAGAKDCPTPAGIESLLRGQLRKP